MKDEGERMAPTYKNGKWYNPDGTLQESGSFTAGEFGAFEAVPAGGLNPTPSAGLTATPNIESIALNRLNENLFGRMSGTGKGLYQPGSDSQKLFTDNANQIETGPDADPGGGEGMTGFQMGQLGLGAANALLGLKQYGLAKDTFDHNKNMALANYEANRTQANNLINRTNNINTTVANKGRSLAIKAGGTGAGHTFEKKGLVKGL